MNIKLKITNLDYSIPYGKQILKDLSFQIEGNQFFGILGKNGAGKTTLIDLIMGARNNTKGSLCVLGEDPMAQDRKYREKIAYVSQDINLKGELSISEFLKFHSAFYQDYDHKEEKALLKYFSLNKENKIASLSTGQKKKVQVVAALASRPELLIVDEITAVLDPLGRNQFFDLLLEHKKKYGLAIILATNIAEDLINRVDKIIFIKKGKGEEYLPSEIENLFKVKSAA